nr:odorant-binding protein 2b-like [Loxodonta africana]
MQTLFLTIMFSLITTLQAQDPLSFAQEEQNITGTWYVKAMVASKNLPLEKRPKKVSPLTFTALKGGSLEISFTFLKKDQCHENRIVMESVGEPGKYSAEGDKKHIYLQELPVKDHYIILGECQHDGRTLRVGKLLGRSLDVNAEALEEFRKFTQQKGFQQENITTPAQMDLMLGVPFPSDSALPLYYLPYGNTQVDLGSSNCTDI